MDNTAAPILCRPFDHGAAVIVYSATKYIGGHGTSVGGLIVDSGNFDWEAAGIDRQPMLNSPDPSYHGAVWTEAVKPLGPIAYILKARTTLLRDLGGAMSPMNAFQFLQGMETLALRMRAHCENATAIAAWLSKKKGVTKVIHPSLMEGESRKRADAVMTGGYGALMGFELEGGVEAGKKFINNLELLYHVANIGDARSLAIHPASTTHSQLSAEDQAASGVTPGYVRLSIGIEHVDDIIADIEQALNNS
jgi:O-acetylhomoserine (thiol)-lyase